MARSKWKGDYIGGSVLRGVTRIYSRGSTIRKEQIGRILEINNGRRNIRKKIKKEMVGHKMGEFAMTRRFR